MQSGKDTLFWYWNVFLGGLDWIIQKCKLIIKVISEFEWTITFLFDYQQYPSSKKSYILLLHDYM